MYSSDISPQSFFVRNYFNNFHKFLRSQTESERVPVHLTNFENIISEAVGSWSISEICDLLAPVSEPNLIGNFISHFLIKYRIA